MQGVGILTDITYMDTQTEKVRFNKLSIVGFSSLLIWFLIFWLPWISWKIGFEGNFFDSMYDIMDKLSDTPILVIFYFLVLLSLTCSIWALVQIRKRKERGKILSIITIVSIVLMFCYGIYSSFQPTKCFPVKDTSQSN